MKWLYIQSSEVCDVNNKDKNSPPYIHKEPLQLSSTKLAGLLFCLIKLVPFFFALIPLFFCLIMISFFHQKKKKNDFFLPWLLVLPLTNITLYISVKSYLCSINITIFTFQHIAKFNITSLANCILKTKFCQI